MIKCVFNLAIDFKSYLRKNFKLLVIVNALLAFSFVLGLILGFNADVESAFNSSSREVFKFLKEEKNAYVASVLWLTFLAFALVSASKFNEFTCKFSIIIACIFLAIAAYNGAGIIVIFGIKSILPLIIVFALHFAATLALEVLYLYNLSDAKYIGCDISIEGYALICVALFAVSCVLVGFECLVMTLLKSIT